jgi:GNAT superfamily N-acetyltransferase
MAISPRSYGLDSDFQKVSKFLFAIHQPGNKDGNFFEAMWEYSYTHPYTDLSLMHNVGIWEDDDEMVGLAFFETELVDAFFCIHADYDWIKPDLLEYAQRKLNACKKNGERISRIYISDFDQAFLALAASHGYERREHRDRPLLRFGMPASFPQTELPEGFILTDMQETDDILRMDRVLWRGFDHPGEPPKDSVDGRRRMQSGPNYRKDLAVVVQAPNGEFASFCGMWFDPVNCFGYVEPVATDPSYRGLGIGKAAVLEGIRRCAKLGAKMAYVWADMPFYRALGFRPSHKHLCLQKTIEF